MKRHILTAAAALLLAAGAAHAETFDFYVFGPYVVSGQTSYAFSDDSVHQVRNVCIPQVPERAALPDVCASHGGDTDNDGICDARASEIVSPSGTGRRSLRRRRPATTARACGSSYLSRGFRVPLAPRARHLSCERTPSHGAGEIF